MSVETTDRTEAFAERIFQAALGAMDLASVYVGDRLGLYRALADGGPLTASGLAAAAGIDERYAREWLEQQTVSEIVVVEDADAAADERRYSLPVAHVDVLLEADSLNHVGPISRALVACYRVMPKLLDAYRSGGGVPYVDYGVDFVEAQAGINRPHFVHLLGNEWLPSMTDVHARLQSESAKVADVGCGGGWSSIAIARAYPNVQVDGYDSDEASVELARANAEAAGLSDRVRFHVRDIAEPPPATRYDLVTIFEAVHDLARPVDALQSLRELANEDGTVLVVDELAADGLAIGDDLQRVFYGWSVLHCLPVGMDEQPSAGTGTVMRAHTLEGYADAAGFTKTDVLPIEHDFFRFYRLTP